MIDTMTTKKRERSRRESDAEEEFGVHSSMEEIIGFNPRNETNDRLIIRNCLNSSMNAISTHLKVPRLSVSDMIDIALCGDFYKQWKILCNLRHLEMVQVVRSKKKYSLRKGMELLKGVEAYLVILRLNAEARKKLGTNLGHAVAVIRGKLIDSTPRNTPLYLDSVDQLTYVVFEAKKI
jgi:hypothetical protein